MVPPLPETKRRRGSRRRGRTQIEGDEETSSQARSTPTPGTAPLPRGSSVASPRRPRSRSRECSPTPGPSTSQDHPGTEQGVERRGPAGHHLDPAGAYTRDNRGMPELEKLLTRSAAREKARRPWSSPRPATTAPTGRSTRPPTGGSVGGRCLQRQRQRSATSPTTGAGSTSMPTAGADQRLPDRHLHLPRAARTWARCGSSHGLAEWSGTSFSTPIVPAPSRLT